MLNIHEVNAILLVFQINPFDFQIGKLLFTYLFHFEVNYYLPLEKYFSAENFIIMKCSEFIRLLMNKGWYVVSQKGSHLKMKHPSIEGIIIVPNHGSNEIGKGLVAKISKVAGLN